MKYSGQEIGTKKRKDKKGRVGFGRKIFQITDITLSKEKINNQTREKERERERDREISKEIEKKRHRMNVSLYFLLKV